MINRKIKIAKLLIAKQVSFDLQIEKFNWKRLANTRIELQLQIKIQIKNVNNKPIFWLNDIAGTRKSIIMQTIA